MLVTHQTMPPVCAVITPLSGWHISTLSLLAGATLEGRLVVLDTARQREELSYLHWLLSHAAHIRISVVEGRKPC